MEGIMNDLLIKRINLNAILPNSKYLLKSIRPVYKYVDGEKTDVVEAMKYEVLEVKFLEILYIKVMHTQPIVSIQELKNSTTRFYVEFVNAVVSYYVNNGRISASVIADNIVLNDEDEEINL